MVLRRLEDDVAHGLSDALVHQHILALARRDPEKAVAAERCDSVRTDARRVDEIAAGVLARARAQMEKAIFALYAGHFSIETVLRAVDHRTFQRAERQLVRADDRAGRSVKRADRFRRDMRLKRPERIAVNDLKPLHTVFQAVFIKRADRRHVRLIKRNDQRGDVLERHVQIAAYALHHAISEDVEFCLVRTGRRVKPRVHNAAVGSARPRRGVVGTIEHTYAQFIRAQLPCDK